jgi:hypothetical protein
VKGLLVPAASAPAATLMPVLSRRLEMSIGHFRQLRTSERPSDRPFIESYHAMKPRE